MEKNSTIITISDDGTFSELEMQAIEHIHVYDASLDLQSITILLNTLKSSL